MHVNAGDIIHAHRQAVAQHGGRGEGRARAGRGSGRGRCRGIGGGCGALTADALEEQAGDEPNAGYPN
eukprot:364604-Chlamydomonas_euryale.AAC.19